MEMLTVIWWKSVKRETRHRWMDGVDWIHLTQDKEKCKAGVNTGMYGRVL
jgi:hypothetical protein